MGPEKSMILERLELLENVGQEKSEGHENSVGQGKSVSHEISMGQEESVGPEK